MQPQALGYCRSPDGEVRIVKVGSVKCHGEGWVSHTYVVELPDAEETSLYEDDFADTEEAGVEQCNWKRPGRKEGLGDNLHLSLYTGISPADLDQGGLGDCWLISAFAALAEFPDAVMRLFDQKTLSEEGLYTVNLYSFAEKRMVKVTVDDRLPCNGRRCAYAGITHDGELWPCILEKAVAKLCGGYSNLSGGWSPFAFAMMTGNTDVAMIQKSKDGDVWSDWPIAWNENDVHKPQWGRVAQKLSSAQLLDLLDRYDNQNYLMCCGSHSGKDTTKNEGGIVQGHAYSLIQVNKNVANSGYNLVQLRNPWGRSEWNGDWSDKSELWEEHPEVAKACGHVVQDDGLFWMDWEDFCNNYLSVYVCRADMGANRGKKVAEQIKANRKAGLDIEDLEPLLQSIGLSVNRANAGSFISFLFDMCKLVGLKC